MFAIGLPLIAMVLGQNAPQDPSAPPRGAAGQFATIEPGSPLPPDVAAALAPIDAAYEAAIRGPLEGWQLGPIRDSYRAVLGGTTDPSAQVAIRSRIARVERQADASEAARTFRAILERSRRRDREVVAVRARLEGEVKRAARPYDAEGLMQRSARKVNGQKVFALVGSDGTTQAYLEVPAGLDASPMLSRRVGVRGDVQYDEGLHARLISVLDIEPLEGR